MNRSAHRSLSGSIGLALSVLVLVACGSTVGGTNVGAEGSDLSGPGGPSASTGTDAGPIGSGGDTAAVGDTAGTSPPGNVGPDKGIPSGDGSPSQAGNGSPETGSAAKPLVLGIVVTKCSNCNLLGPGVGSTAHSQQDIWTAMVRAVNARGGILGRKIQPVWGEIDTANSDWNTMFQAVCASFTQDHHVAAVTGASFVVNQGFANCLAARGVAWFNGVPTVGANGNSQMLQRLPYVLASMPPDDMVQLLAYTSAVADGWLKPTTKLGVLRDTCASDVDTWNHTVLPYLRSQHIKVTDDEAGPCTHGAQDQGAAASFEQSALLRMRSRGVDTVVAFGIPLVLFVENAESQHWYPKYLTSGGMAGTESLLPPDQLTNIHTAGWEPFADVDTPPAQGPAQKSCLAELRSGGVSPEGTELFLFLTVCAVEWLYEATLTQAAGATGSNAMMSALSQLGGKVINPLIMNNATSFTSSKHSGPVQYRSSLYVNGGFEYVGPLRQLPHT